MKGLGFYEAAAQIIPILTLVALLLNPEGLPRAGPYLPLGQRVDRLSAKSRKQKGGRA